MCSGHHNDTSFQIPTFQYCWSQNVHYSYGVWIGEHEAQIKQVVVEGFSESTIASANSKPQSPFS